MLKHSRIASRKLLAKLLLATSPFAFAFPIFAQETPTAAAVDQSAITLDRIMSDPDWLGRSPESGYWADDSASLYYQRKRAGSPIQDWFQADLQGNILQVVEDDQLSAIDVPNGELSKNGNSKVYVRGGDIFIKHLKTGKVRQMTRTGARESTPSFMADGKRIMFRRDGSVLARHLTTGLEQDLVDVRMEKDPAESRDQKDEGFLKAQQLRLFDVLRNEQSDSDALREESEREEAADKTRVPKPWYLGDSQRLEDLQVSPNGRWCIVILASKSGAEGTQDKMPEFVDESGYVNVRNVRSLVGTSKAASDKLLLLDLVKREHFELNLDTLPEFDTDRLADIRSAGETWLSERDSDGSEGSNESETVSAEPTEAQPNTSTDKELGKSSRTLQAGNVQWNAAGNQAVVQLFSDDNKDRWLASVDLKNKQLNCVMHRYDPAWVNRGISQFGWLKDDQSIYYLSEQTDYAHLYIAHIPSQSTRQLTNGEFVVSNVQLGPSGEYLYYQANAPHPGIYEVYRANIASGDIEQLTELGGMNEFELSPDEKHLLITHSTALTPPELWIQPITDDAQEPVQITQTVSTEFLQLPWVAPQFVTVPSRAGKPIHARLYLPPGTETGNNEELSKRPAVVFIHGAGYLQNAHQGWSVYFREFMFHSLLAYRGYVVLDMDYRASAGYGRDWRTAIYRHMGGPEVEDLLDGREWLGQNHRVDIDRIGLYGGSYGGFLTMMALFQQPDAFACGAALRPVTDWAHYNHGYTSNILNTPDIDPEAYYRSSPIELAEGLADPLLICHGMVDDNVFFKDTARLAQRLIELKKSDWEVALYPVEAHGFVQPTSWYDEYRRIFELFEEHIGQR